MVARAPPKSGIGLRWPHLASAFHVARATDVLALRHLERHQSVRSAFRWIRAEEPPLALVFLSHRWETLEHRDPEGKQLRAMQAFLQHLCASIEAMLVTREERLRLVGSLAREGALQGEELARRLLDFGPFVGESAGIPAPEAREVILRLFAAHRDDRAAFRRGLAERVGVWLDYLCLPQKPLLPEDEPEFRRSLAQLDDLVATSTVLALRRAGDDYDVRGWCAAEHFLASAHSFARALFVDMDRMEGGGEVAVPDPPATPSSNSGPATAVMKEAYEADLAAFREACAEWYSPFDQAWARRERRDRGRGSDPLARGPSAAVRVRGILTRASSHVTNRRARRHRFERSARWQAQTVAPWRGRIRPNASSIRRFATPTLGRCSNASRAVPTADEVVGIVTAEEAIHAALAVLEAPVKRVLGVAWRWPVPR